MKESSEYHGLFVEGDQNERLMSPGGEGLMSTCNTPHLGPTMPKMSIQDELCGNATVMEASPVSKTTSSRTLPSESEHFIPSFTNR